MLEKIHQGLGIPADYASSCGMPMHEDCPDLVAVGEDAFGRPARLERQTAQAWQRLQQAASAAGVVLHLVSAYRSTDYQRELIERKLARGLLIADILKVNAAPGYSEHHSGRAIDIGTPGFAALEEEFEKSEAFAWLLAHASRFGFRLSFPRNNRFGVMYEPWHWFYAGAAAESVEQAEEQAGKQAEEQNEKQA